MSQADTTTSSSPHVKEPEAAPSRPLFNIGAVVKTWPQGHPKCMTCTFKCGGRYGMVVRTENGHNEVNFGTTSCIFLDAELEAVSNRPKLRVVE